MTRLTNPLKETRPYTAAKMANAKRHTLPRGLIDTTLIRLDTIFAAFWSKLEERQQKESLPQTSPLEAEHSMPITPPRKRDGGTASPPPTRLTLTKFKTRSLIAVRGSRGRQSQDSAHNRVRRQTVATL
ncbi:Hypothetical predicted protein [Pelobates cultripes]|uniref:Uncharacterized protein n=1 Tax=Pelobates cultripes TaxID=61616 RepID=A0AAD1WHL9_PELCU|nr:Hypothetical predicted protein [Pelobates cultripes]